MIQYTSSTALVFTHFQVQGNSCWRRTYKWYTIDVGPANRVVIILTLLIGTDVATLMDTIFTEQNHLILYRIKAGASAGEIAKAGGTIFDHFKMLKSQLTV